MSLIREVRLAQRDRTAHDDDEVCFEGFMTGIFARNPYKRGSNEHREWKKGHRLTNKQAAKIKWPIYWLKRLTGRL